MTPYELEVREPLRDGAALVVLAGELDLTNASEVEQRLEGQLAQGLVLDLNEVTFADSAALHMLFRLAKSTPPEHPLRIVLEPSATIARAVSIVGLDGVATVGASVDDLVAGPLA